MILTARAWANDQYGQRQRNESARCAAHSNASQTSQHAARVFFWGANVGRDRR